jgi:hypothetical protein
MIESVGMMTFLIDGKIKLMFQTTNQRKSERKTHEKTAECVKCLETIGVKQKTLRLYTPISMSFVTSFKLMPQALGDFFQSDQGMSHPSIASVQATSQCFKV